MLGIYLPSLNRPHRFKLLVDNLKSATKAPYRLYLGLEPHDEDSIKEAQKLGIDVTINFHEPCFSGALQSIYETTDEDIFFWANDDFEFTDGWDVKPLERMAQDENIGVLGVHDGNPKTKYSTISFVRRSYIEEQSGVVDMPNRVLYPYKHNYADDELTLTAQKRGVWDRCEGPCIIHLHPSFTWLEGLPMDDTYRKNDRVYGEDSETFMGRRHLFE